MFDISPSGSVGLLLVIAGISGLLLGGLLVARWMGAEPEARSFRATDRPSTLGRATRISGTALPWLLGLVLAGSLLSVVAITLGLVSG